MVLWLGGCSDFVFWDVLAEDDDGPTGAELVIAPIRATVSAGATVQFRASGGTRPYTFAVVSGIGVIDADSGLYTAPNTDASEVVRVVDGAGANSDAQVTVLE